MLSKENGLSHQEIEEIADKVESSFNSYERIIGKEIEEVFDLDYQEVVKLKEFVKDGYFNGFKVAMEAVLEIIRGHKEIKNKERSEMN